jgi:hypothetical protein
MVAALKKRRLAVEHGMESEQREKLRPGWSLACVLREAIVTSRSGCGESVTNDHERATA